MNETQYGPIAVQMRGIVRTFGDFMANDHIDLTVHHGEIHAVLGENGAGKSTLMNILYGLLSPNEGTIELDGNPVQIQSPDDAIKLGIGMVHQHFMLIESFTVAENIVLGQEPVLGSGVLDMRKARADVESLSERYGLRVEPDRLISTLSVGMQQRVEILKTLYRGAEILIFDEPTAVLTPQEIADLMGMMKTLTAQGKAIIIITHKLKEIKACADRCTIIRRGKLVSTMEVADTSEAQMASMMVGRSISTNIPRNEFHPGEYALDIRDLTVLDDRNIEAIRNLSLAVRSGEILGLAGVDGNGQRELAEAITGLRSVRSGQILVCGQPVKHGLPADYYRAGVGSIPEDRQKRGLVMEYDIAENLVLKNHTSPPYSQRGILQDTPMYAHAQELIHSFDIRPPDPAYRTGSLSGGNQQKVILAREIDHGPAVLVANQPTRGLDVGAIEFIYQALIRQRDMGRAILLISLELDEIINLADRIAVIYEGRIVDIMDAKQADEERIGLLMAGGADHAE